MKIPSIVLLPFALTVSAVAEPPPVEEIPSDSSAEVPPVGIEPIAPPKNLPAVEEPEPTIESPTKNTTSDTAAAEENKPETVEKMEPEHGIYIVNSDSWTAQLSGYVRTLGRWTQNDSGTAFVGRTDGFALQNARLGVQANYKDKVTVVLSIEGAADERTGANDLTGQLAFGLRDAYVDYKLGDNVELRAGHFKPLFDGEENASNESRHFVNRALSSRGVAIGEGFPLIGLGINRDIGVAIRSEPATTGNFSLGWEVAVQNGNGPNEAAADNDQPAVSGALVGQTDALRVWLTARFSKDSDGEFPMRLDSTRLSGAFGFHYAAEKFKVGAQALVRRSTFETSGGGDELAIGVHGELHGRISERLWAGYRYSMLDPSDLLKIDRLQEHTLGVVYSPNWYSKFLLNYTLPLEQSGRKLDNQRVELLLHVGF